MFIKWLVITHISYDNKNITCNLFPACVTNFLKTKQSLKYYKLYLYSYINTTRTIPLSKLPINYNLHYNHSLKQSIGITYHKEENHPKNKES